MVIAIWCGVQKPNNLNEYLSPFVEELNTLLENGIIINGQHIYIAVRCFICDSPARAFMKGKLQIKHNIYPIVYHIRTYKYMSFG